MLTISRTRKRVLACLALGAVVAIVLAVFGRSGSDGPNPENKSEQTVAW
jgi:hypothetical protein